MSSRDFRAVSARGRSASWRSVSAWTASARAGLSYGTKTVPRVDKIVGPGGIFVATAKRKVFGRVDIDMIAGPKRPPGSGARRCPPFQWASTAGR